MLVANEQWQMAITHMQSLADHVAVDQLFYKNNWIPITYACARSAPLEVVQLMLTKAKLDSRKRSLLAIVTSGGNTTLRYAAGWHSDPAVVELLIREHPLALCETDDSGNTPQQVATNWNRSAAITSLLTDATNALAASDYAALAARVHCDERTIRCNILPPATLALRTTLLLCIKHGYVYARRSQRLRNEAPETVALDTLLAIEVLNDNVWSHSMTFL